MGKLGYGVKLATAKPVSALEDWLETNCSGQWRLDVEGVSADLKKKTIAVYFENEAEKVKFKKFYGSIS